MTYDRHYLSYFLRLLKVYSLLPLDFLIFMEMFLKIDFSKVIGYPLNGDFIGLLHFYAQVYNKRSRNLCLHYAYKTKSSKIANHWIVNTFGLEKDHQQPISEFLIRSSWSPDFFWWRLPRGDDDTESNLYGLHCCTSCITHSGRLWEYMRILRLVAHSNQLVWIVKRISRIPTSSKKWKPYMHSEIQRNQREHSVHSQSTCNIVSTI